MGKSATQEIKKCGQQIIQDLLAILAWDGGLIIPFRGRCIEVRALP